MEELFIGFGVTLVVLAALCFMLNYWRCCGNSIATGFNRKEISAEIKKRRSRGKGALVVEGISSDLKYDDEEEYYYSEEKFPVINDAPFFKAVREMYLQVIASPFIWTGTIFILTSVCSIWSMDLSKSVRDALGVALTAFSGLFSVLIALLFQEGMQKNKENKRLYQALCGDIKGMAMWVSALTNDDDKYRIKYSDESKSSIVEIETRDSVEVEMAKIRLLLSVLAPVAKHVLRQAPLRGDEGVQYDLLDDKYRVKVIFPTGACGQFRFNPPWFLGWLRTMPSYVVDTSQAWSKLKRCNPDFSKLGRGTFTVTGGYDKEVVQVECNDNQIKVYLYEKIRYMSQTTDMDLFEVIMYCLLDQINVLQEKRSIGTIKAYGKERDLISKWQHIYGSWGTMFSLCTYDQPTQVHFTICVSLMLYTVGLTFYNGSFAKEAFHAPAGGDDWSDEDIGDVYLSAYVGIKTFLSVLPFTMFWIYSRTIGKVFKKGVSAVIKNDARDTQRQVSLLLSSRAELDKRDMLQFDIDYDLQMKQSRERSSIKTGVLYKKRGQMGVTNRRGSVVDDEDPTPRRGKERRDESERPKRSQTTPGGVGSNRIRYKNVNF